MAAKDPTLRRLIASAGANTLHGRPLDDEARRALALARVEAKIAAAVAEAPPLPPAVRRRLVELIRSVQPAVPTIT